MKVERVALSVFRKSMSDFINKVQYGGQMIIITSHGKDVAACVSMEQAKLLVSLETVFAKK